MKNYENLSSNRMNDNSLGINRDLEHLKINDDFSNNELLEDEFSIIENNSYIDLSNVVENHNDNINRNDKNKIDISSLPLDNDSNI